MYKLRIAVVASLLFTGCAASQPIPTDTDTLAAKRAAGLFKPTTEKQMNELPVDVSHLGEPLDLSDYHETFSDDFNAMTVTDERGAGPWYSPVHSDYGASHLVGPRDGKGPVLVRDGKLVLQMYEENGKWISSSIQTLTRSGIGFAQQYGYFEMSAKFPPANPVWGGLWLHSDKAMTGPDVAQTEVDIAEVYPADPRGHHSTIHIWPGPGRLKGDVTKQVGRGAYTKVDGMVDGTFHTYGAKLTKDFIIFYYDRKELSRMPMLPEFRTPQYMLVSLTMLGKFQKEAKGLMEMEVDYVKAYQSKDEPDGKFYK